MNAPDASRLPPAAPIGHLSRRHCLALPWLLGAGAAAASIETEHPALRALLEAAGRDGSNTHGVVVQQGGRVLAEAYYRGRDRPSGAWFEREVDFDAGTLHDLRSVSKSVVSLLVGIALDRGLLRSTEQAVFDFFPEHADLLDDRRRALTLRHLLDMATGWEWDENTHPYTDPRNSETLMARAPDALRYALERPFVAAPGSTWEYCGGATTVLGAVLERAGGQPLAALAREWLFGPLGISRFEWRESRGRALPAGGLRLTPRALAIVGQMTLDHGRLGPREIVPAAWIQEISTPRYAGWDGYRYGAQWWMARAPRSTSASAPASLETSASATMAAPPPPWFGGWGNGGQRLLVVPSQQLVVVITAGRYNQPQSGRASMQLFTAIARALRG